MNAESMPPERCPAAASVPPSEARAVLASGWGGVRASGAAIAVAYLLSLLLALPLAAALQLSLADSLEHREAAERMLESWDGLWHRSFAAQAQGISATFDAGVVGIGAVFRSLDDLVRGQLLELPAPLVTAGLLYLLGWVFIGGGLRARFAGDDRSVLASGARHFGRMLALAAVGWAAWALVLGLGLPALSAWVEVRVRDVIDERVHAAWLLGKYAVVWLAVAVVRLVVDYAKAAAIERPGRSLGSSLREGLRVLRRCLGAVVGIHVRLGAVGLALTCVYWVVAPGVEQGNPFMILVAFLIGQLSVVVRVVMRSWTLASEQALVRRVEPR